MLKYGPKTILGYRCDGRPIYNIAGGSEPVPETETSTQPVTLGDVEPSQGQPLQDDNSGNPAWQEFLDVLPTQLHSQVTPVLEKWDRGVQERFEKLHEENEPYKAYQNYIDNEVDPETIDYALGIMQALNEDPRKMYDAMGEYYNFTQAEKQQIAKELGEDNDDDFMGDPEDDPRISRLEQGVEVMAQALLTREQQEQARQEDAALESAMTKLHDKHGEFDDSYVLMFALQNDADLDTAVEAYRTFEQSIAQKTQAPQAPSVLGAGGGAVATNRPDPAKLSPAEKKDLAVQMLKAAASQNT